MKTAPLPFNELERLLNLQSFHILDSAPEKEFDQLVELALSISHCPIGAISFIDHDRQWFKARIGIPVEQTPRDVSICSHAILHNDFFQVPDLRTDPRFFDNPIINSELNLRYYGGVPLMGEEGYIIGTLCVMHTRPYELTSTQIHQLEILARQVMVKLNLNKSLEHIKRQEENLIYLAKLASLGELAAVTSHEINNVAFIMSAKHAHLNSLIQNNKVITKGTLSQELSSLSNLSQRLMNIITGIKKFSRKDEFDLEDISLKHLIDETLVLCRDKLRLTNTHLSLNLPGQELILTCAPTAISQVLINLIYNSLDAIITKAEKWIDVSVCKNPENEIEFSVTDCGEGIPLEMQEKIMNPFFTTKKRGSGTGLGLSISRTIAQTHGGDLYYDDKSPHTRFVLRLPVTSRHAK